MGKVSNFLTNIFKGTNKQQQSTYYESPIMNASGSSFVASESNVVKIPEFMSAIDMIANDIAAIDYKETKIKFNSADNIRYNERVKNSKWEMLLNKQPNDFMTSIEFWKMNIYNLFIRGGFFFYIYRDTSGRPTEFIPIHPNSIRKAKDKDGVYFYEVTYFDNEYTNPVVHEIPFDDVFSMYAFDLENITDMNFRSVYSTLLEKLGLKNQYDLIQLNQSPKILAHVKVPNNIGQEEKNILKESLSEFFRNAKKIDSSSVLVTDPKAEVEILGGDKTKISNAVDKDFIKEIMVGLANMLHIPLPKLNVVDTGQSFYKSREGINIDYVADTIKPWVNKIVSKLNSLAFSKSTTKEFTFSIDKLLMVDHATRAEYLSKNRQNAIMTTNELREKEGLAPVPDGDKLFGNGTLVELGKGQNKDKNNNDDSDEKGGKT